MGIMQYARREMKECVWQCVFGRQRRDVTIDYRGDGDGFGGLKERG
jgi:hypothetical protein